MRKILSIAAIFCLVTFGLSFNALASNSNESIQKSESQELINLSKNYNLQTIDKSEIPKDITPLEFNTIEEAEAFLNKIKSEKAMNFENAKVSDSSSYITKHNNFLGALFSRTSGSGIITKTIPGTNAYLIRGEGVLNFDWTSDSNGNKTFTNVNDFDADYTGATLFLAYELLTYNDTITNRGRTVSIQFTGKTSYYFLIKGVLKLYDTIDTSNVHFSYSEIS